MNVDMWKQFPMFSVCRDQQPLRMQASVGGYTKILRMDHEQAC